MSGIVTRLATHPLDTAKAKLQASSSRQHYYKGPLDVLVQTARHDGLRGWYRGFGAVMMGGTPGTILYFCSYEFFKGRFSNESSFGVYFVSGMLAETLACTIYVPVDVIKERLQVQNVDRGGYKNSFDALRTISTQEGLSGLYRGFPATLGSFGPFSALYFMFYEEAKAVALSYLRIDGSTEDLPFLWTVTCSASSGAVASFLTSPLDMAKLRLQIQRGKLDKKNVIQYRGVWDCLRHSYSQHGLHGLFRGAGARMLHFAPATAISMTTFETCRSFAGKLLNG